MLTQNLICFTPKAIQLSAYFYAICFFMMGVLLGIVIMKRRSNRRLRRKRK